MTEDEAAKRPPRVMADLGYIAECIGPPERLVKIGRSSDPHGRIRSIQTSSPHEVRLIAIVAGGGAMERILKAEMRGHCRSGEWYAWNLVLEKRLREWEQEGRFCKQHKVDAAFIREHIRPAVLTYLDGREPNNNEAGDFVYRLLNGGVPDLNHRAHDLMMATKGTVSPELMRGWLSVSGATVVRLSIQAAA